jgi:hypothetical protein
VRKYEERCKVAARDTAKMWGRSLPPNQSPQETMRSEEGEIISSPYSPHPQILTLPSDLFGQQIRVPASACLVKHPRVDTSGVSGLSSWLGLMLVCSIL